MKRIRFGPVDFLGCQDALLLLDDYLDGEIAPVDKHKVHTHLRLCFQCRPKFRFEQDLDVQVREKLVEQSVPDDLKTRLRVNLESENSDT